MANEPNIALLEEEEKLLLRKRDLLLQRRQDPSALVEQRQAGRQAIPIQRPGIRGLISPALEPGTTLKTLGGVAQREEAAIAGPALALQQGRGFKEAGSEFVRGLKGEQQSEIGDVITQAGGTEGQSQLGGFLLSLGLPSNLALTLATGGAGKAASVGAVEKTGGGLSAIFRRLGADVRGKSLKDLRNIEKRIGIKKLFQQGVDAPEFLSDKIVPQVVDTVKQRVFDFSKDTLRRLGVVQKDIDDVVRLKTKHNLQRVPTTAEADKLFKETVDNIPEDFLVQVSPFKNRLTNILKSVGAIDEKGEVVLGVLSDNRTINTLADIHHGLKTRIRLGKPERIERLLSSQPISPEALKFQLKTGKKTLAQEVQLALKETVQKPDVLDKTQFIRTRSAMTFLLTGDKRKDRLVLEALDALDDAAIKSGASGLDKAKDVFRISRVLEPVVNKINKPGYDKTIRGVVGRAGQRGKLEDRKEVVDLVGKALGGEVNDLSTANRILTTSSELGPATGGLLAKPVRDVSRKLIRTSEEKIRPGVQSFARRTGGVGRLGRRGLGLAERGVVRRGLQDQ